MTIAVSWDEQERIWTLTPGETFAVSDVLQLLNKTDWEGARRFLWDFSGLVEGPSASGDLRRMLAESENTIAAWEGSRVAIVATADLHYGIARMYMAFAANLDIEYQTFRDEDAARDWLRSGPS